MRLSRRRTPASLAILALAAIAASGCYNIRAPFNANVQTVYVPVFRSVTFRRDVNLMLTEQIIKEVERRTPYKVVGSPEGADTTLEGVINFTDKNLFLENPFNLPRQLTATLTAQVTWTDNRTKKKIGDPITPMLVTEVVNFFPEAGETSEAAFLKTCEKMAQELVSAMEQPW